MTNSCMESIIFSDDCKGEGKNRKVIFPLHYLRGNRDSSWAAKWSFSAPNLTSFSIWLTVQSLPSCHSSLEWLESRIHLSLHLRKWAQKFQGRNNESREPSERVINGVFPQLSQHHIFGHRSSKLSLENYATKVTNMLLQQIVYLSPSSSFLPLLLHKLTIVVAV